MRTRMYVRLPSLKRSLVMGKGWERWNPAFVIIMAMVNQACSPRASLFLTKMSDHKENCGIFIRKIVKSATLVMLGLVTQNTILGDC